MERGLVFWVAVLTLGLAVVSGPAQAATDREALKCGLAIRKLQAKQAALVGQGAVKLCKDPSKLSDIAAKITATLNKAVARINAKFSAANCDPDIDQIGGLPTPLLNQATTEAQLGGVASPLGELCNNTDDHP